MNYLENLSAFIPDYLTIKSHGIWHSAINLKITIRWPLGWNIKPRLFSRPHHLLNQNYSIQALQQVWDYVLSRYKQPKYRAYLVIRIIKQQHNTYSKSHNSIHYYVSVKETTKGNNRSVILYCDSQSEENLSRYKSIIGPINTIKLTVRNTPLVILHPQYLDNTNYLSIIILNPVSNFGQLFWYTNFIQRKHFTHP